MKKIGPTRPLTQCIMTGPGLGSKALTHTHTHLCILSLCLTHIHTTHSEKCNGSCFVDVSWMLWGLKLCTVFCLCFALSLQSSEVSWVFYVSPPVSSTFLSLHVCVLTCMNLQMLDAGCFGFLLMFHLPPSSEWNDKKHQHYHWWWHGSGVSEESQRHLAVWACWGLLARPESIHQWSRHLWCYHD